MNQDEQAPTVGQTMPEPEAPTEPTQAPIEHDGLQPLMVAPSPPKRFGKLKKILVLVYSLVLIFAGVWLGVRFLGGGETPETVPLPEPEPQTEVPVEAATTTEDVQVEDVQVNDGSDTSSAPDRRDWQTYRSNARGFEMQMPSTWTVKDWKDRERTDFLAPDVDRNSFSVSFTWNQLDSIYTVTGTTSIGKYDWHEFKSPGVFPIKGFSIRNGEKHFNFEAYDKEELRHVLETFSFLGDTTIRSVGEEGPTPQTPREALFESVIVDGVQTALNTRDWKTHKSADGGFSFKYPKNYVVGEGSGVSYTILDKRTSHRATIEAETLTNLVRVRDDKFNDLVVYEPFGNHYYRVPLVSRYQGNYAYYATLHTPKPDLKTDLNGHASNLHAPVFVSGTLEMGYFTKIYTIVQRDPLLPLVYTVKVSGHVDGQEIETFLAAIDTVVRTIGRYTDEEVCIINNRVCGE